MRRRATDDRADATAIVLVEGLSESCIVIGVASFVDMHASDVTCLLPKSPKLNGASVHINVVGSGEVVDAVVHAKGAGTDRLPPKE